MRPLSDERPKPLMPVANVPLVDIAVARVRALTASIAVNAHHHAEDIAAHLADVDVHLSVESDQARGTAGALGVLHDWIDGRAVLVVNGDTWCTGDLEPLLDGWDGERIRVLVHGEEDLARRPGVAGALMPWSEVAGLTAEPTGLYEASWQRAVATGRLDTVRHVGDFVDCATAADYLRANLMASGGQAVVAPDAEVEGVVERSVVWDGARVRAGERLVDAIRTPTKTVLVRPALHPVAEADRLR